MLVVCILRSDFSEPFLVTCHWLYLHVKGHSNKLWWYWLFAHKGVVSLLHFLGSSQWLYLHVTRYTTRVTLTSSDDTAVLFCILCNAIAYAEIRFPCFIFGKPLGFICHLCPASIFPYIYYIYCIVQSTNDFICHLCPAPNSPYIGYICYMYCLIQCTNDFICHQYPAPSALVAFQCTV